MTPQDEIALLRAELDRRKREEEKQQLLTELGKRKVFAHIKAVYGDDEAPDKIELLNRTVYNNKWIPEKYKRGLTPKQAQFLAYEGRECLYGGSVGGGKASPP